MSGGRTGRGPDWSVWARVSTGERAPLDLMHARLVRHRFAPHLHDQFAVGACTAGREAVHYRGELHHAGPGTVVVIEPGEVHTGAAAAEDGFTYRVMYPEPELLTDPAPDASPSRRAPPRFPGPVLDDPWLAARLRSLHAALSRPGEHGPGLGRAEAQERLSELFGLLVQRHALAPAGRAPPEARAGPRVARPVMDRLAGDPRCPPSLGQLAAELGLSRYQVLRAFRSEVGMPPFAWLAQYRVERARTLLEAGTTPAEVAAAVGFADQAHLTRWFRRVVGVTPGTYRNGVQDLLTRRRRF